ncbi:MAG TPA: competence protein ComFB [Cyanothece sp. UBA12306]|nr:competence protein ComFB [Cyanothece sp. UBA12306]
MSIQNIVERALEDGYLTPIMEAEVGRICESAAELPLEEYMALDQLMGALLTGEVTAMPRKQFINVMEELVLSEAISRMAELETKNTNQADASGKNLANPDVGDIAAYALNRLPPLYATTEEGAQYQRQRAKEELQTLIVQQVEEGIRRYIECPIVPDRNPLEKPDRQDVLEKMTALLKSLAPE